jgi:hypothetical protein
MTPKDSGFNQDARKTAEVICAHCHERRAWRALRVPRLDRAFPLCAPCATEVMRSGELPAIQLRKMPQGVYVAEPGDDKPMCARSSRRRKPTLGEVEGDRGWYFAKKRW